MIEFGRCVAAGSNALPIDTYSVRPRLARDRDIAHHGDVVIAVFSGTCENLASHGLNGGAVADLFLRHKKSLGIEDPLALPKNANHLHGIARMNFKWQSDRGCSDIEKLMATELRQRTDAAAIFHGYITAAASLLSDIDVAPPSCEITQAAFAAWLTTTHGLATVCPTRPEGQPCSLASLITSWTRQVSCLGVKSST